MLKSLAMSGMFSDVEQRKNAGLAGNANCANSSDGWIHIEPWRRFFALWVFVACRTNAVPFPAEGIAGIDSFCESRFCSRKASNEINGFDGVLPGRSPANFQAVKVKGRGCSGVPRRLRGIL